MNRQNLDVVKEEEEEEEKGRTLSSKTKTVSVGGLSKESSSTPSSDTNNERKYVNVVALVGFESDILRNEIFNSIIRLRNRSFYHTLI